LVVDKTYTLTITASVGSSSSSASVKVYVAHGTVTAAVVGGYTRSTPVDKLFVLDASGSSDADTSPSAVSTLAYQVIHPLTTALSKTLLIKHFPTVILLNFCRFHDSSDSPACFLSSGRAPSAPSVTMEIPAESSALPTPRRVS
jgi:hypothetical protein